MAHPARKGGYVPHHLGLGSRPRHTRVPSLGGIISPALPNPLHYGAWPQAWPWPPPPRAAPPAPFTAAQLREISSSALTRPASTSMASFTPGRYPGCQGLVHVPPAPQPGGPRPRRCAPWSCQLDALLRWCASGPRPRFSHPAQWPWPRWPASLMLPRSGNAVHGGGHVRKHRALSAGASSALPTTAAQPRTWAVKRSTSGLSESGDALQLVQGAAGMAQAPTAHLGHRHPQAATKGTSTRWWCPTLRWNACSGNAGNGGQPPSPRMGHEVSWAVSSVHPLQANRHQQRIS